MEDYTQIDETPTYPNMGNVEVSYSDLIQFRGKVPINDYFVRVRSLDGSGNVIKVPASKVDRFVNTDWEPVE